VDAPSSKAPAVDQLRFSAEWIGEQLGRAERRRVTVLTTGIVAPSSAEALIDGKALAQLQCGIRNAVHERGGQVVWQSGADVMACWGVPRISEDHARLAIRAALRIVELCSPQLPLACAIETGLVVAGANAAEANGLTLAARAYQRSRQLLSEARPGWVVVSDTFRLLIGRSFELEPLATTSGERRWLVLKPRGGRGSVSRPASTVVGHLSERQILDRVWLRIVDGQPQCVSITGEAGIGKSTLLQYLGEKARAAKAHWIEFECLPEARRAPLHAVRQGLRSLLVNGSGGLAEFISALEDTDRSLLQFLLEQREGGPDFRLDMEGSRQERIFSILLDWIAELSKTSPIVLAFEDLHWADQATLDLVARIANRLPNLGPVGLVYTSRAPEWRHFETEADRSRLSLSRLAPEEIRQLLACSEIGSALSPTMRRRIAIRSEGIPLFALELARLCANCPENDRLDLLLEPGPLNTILSARLDALGNLKLLVQAAAIIGREFDVEVLGLVLQMEPSDLIEDLQRLERSGILQPLPCRKGSTRFRFSHVLLREAAYASVLEARRAELHYRTAEALAKDERAADEAPEIIARHYAAAGDPKKALTWWLKAGARASEMAATRSAVHHLTQALAVIRQNPGAANPQEAVAVLRLLGAQLVSLKGNAAPEAVETFRRCLDLSREAPAADGEFDALWALHTCHLVRGEITEALAVGERLTDKANRDGSEERRLRAHRVQGLAKLLNGQLDDAFRHLRLALDLYDEARHASLRFQYASDQGALARAHLAWGEAIAGDIVSSNRNAEAALALSSRLRHPHTSAHVLCVLAARAQTLGERATASALAYAGRVIAERHEFPYWIAWADIILGWSQAYDLGYEAAIHQIEKAIGAYRRTGAGQALPYALLLLADVALKYDRPHRALSAATEGWQLAEQYGIMLYAAELLRLRAVAKIRSGSEPGDVSQILEQAEQLAARQGAKTFFCRIAEFRLHFDRRQMVS